VLWVTSSLSSALKCRVDLSSVAFLPSADLASRDNNLTIRAYIVSAIAVLGASLLGGLVILSHLRGRSAVVEDSEEDLS